MENKPFKTIVLKKEVVSNLNDNQMNVMWGGRAISYESLFQEWCNTVEVCCTLFADCTDKTYTDTRTFVAQSCFPVCPGA